MPGTGVDELMRSLYRLSIAAVLIFIPFQAAVGIAAQPQESGSQSTTESTMQNRQGLNQVFVGKVAWSKGDVVIVDETIPVSQESRTIYHVENESQAAPYVGDKVVVTGTLDQRTDTIHIVRIGPAPSPDGP
jgi:hypothetical protein